MKYLKQGGRKSSIYQQGNYSWQLVLCGMMSYPGRGAKTSPPTRVIIPTLLFSFIYCLKTMHA